MRRVFETGVLQTVPEIKAEVAAVIVDAVTVWRTTALVEEPTPEWLEGYLRNEVGRLYHSWDRNDGLWAIYGFFCFKRRTAEQFTEALEDLCTFLKIPTSETQFLKVRGQIAYGRIVRPIYEATMLHLS